MCFGGGSPSPQALPAPAPTQQSSAVQGMVDADKKRRRAAASNTILTSGEGVASQPTSGVKTLLGA